MSKSKSTIKRQLKTQPLKVGFDLDGVLLYNPARTIRPIVAAVKKKFIKKKKTNFYVPQSKPAQFLFSLLHKSSFMLAPGFHNIRPLTEKGLIEPHIITARFDYLKHDFHHWLYKMNAKHYFKSHQHNQKNEQPHIFKARLVKELGLDIFIEDNWDIINHINRSRSIKGKQPKVLWVTNIIDNHLIDYPEKHLTLASAIKRVTQLAKQNKP
jgi:hypothetical protein